MSLLDRLFNRPLTREAFAKKMMDALSRAGLKPLEYNPGEFSIVLDGVKTKLFLDNVFTDYNRLSGKAREEVVSRFVLSAADSPSVPEEFAAAKPRLMPIVRDPSAYSLMRLRTIKEGKDPNKLKVLTQPLADDLVTVLAYDMPHGIVTVGHDTLTKWGVSLDEAIAAAKDNLREHTLESGLAQAIPGTYMGKWADSYDTSRLLLTDLIYRLAVHGDPVAFLPNRDALWITGSRDANAIKALLTQGREDHFNCGHPLSPNLYVLVNGEWSLCVPGDPSLREMWLELKRDRDGIHYHQQKELLDAIHQRDHIDLFVTNYNMVERKVEGDGKTRATMCVWSAADALLPQTENITFVLGNEKTDVFTVPWHAAIKIAGECMEEQPYLYPKRFRTRTLPSEAQIAELRKIPDSFADFRRGQ